MLSRKSPVHLSSSFPHKRQPKSIRPFLKLDTLGKAATFPSPLEADGEFSHYSDKLRLTFYVDAIPEGVTSSSFQCKVKSLLFNIGVNYPLKELYVIIVLFRALFKYIFLST